MHGVSVGIARDDVFKDLVQMAAFNLRRLTVIRVNL